MSHIEEQVVVWDPEGEYWPGALLKAPDLNQAGQVVTGAGLADALAARGVVLLPVVPKLFRLSGVGGYAKREWGAGWPMSIGVPRNISPLTMYCTTDYGELHWVARLMGEGSCEGSLKLVSDASQPNPLRAGLTYDGVMSQVDLRNLGPADKHGGWVVGGRARVKFASDGHYGFGLYGAASSLRVVWAAVSLSAHA